MEKNERTTTLESKVRTAVAESCCTYREVIDLLADLRTSYLNSAFNRVVKHQNDDWTKAT